MNKYFSVLLILLLTCCKEEFWPVIDKYENLLVVNGTITNQPGPYTIRLSTSSLVQDASFNPYSGAMVKITDHLGTEETLEETGPGIYQTSPAGIQGKIGNKYKLLIYTPDEKVYESSYTKLLVPVSIDSVYGIVESRPTNDPEFYYWGYQFYLDTEMADSDSTNFLWRLNATYEYHSDYLIWYYYDGELRLFPNSDSLWRCWNNDNAINFFTANVTNSSETKIKNFPLNYVNTETRKLSVRYSLEVSQYSVDEQANKYFDQIKSINDDQGTIYSTLPHQVRGNVKNINDKFEPVLGYFLVGGKTAKRIFVNRPPINIFRYSICKLEEPDYEAVEGIYEADPAVFPLYLTFDTDYVLALPVPLCLDCTQKGGSITKPDFWIDY